MSTTSILTLGQINEALGVASVTTAQLSALGFEPLDNKEVCKQLPPEQTRMLRSARIYRAASLPAIRAALAKALS